jgi:hypothetical protein
MKVMLRFHGLFSPVGHVKVMLCFHVKKTTHIIVALLQNLFLQVPLIFSIGDQQYDVPML